VGLRVLVFKKTIVYFFALILCVLIYIYSYFVVGTFRNFEFLLMCSQGRESLIPKRICQIYLFNFAGTPDEISDINRGIGIVWALSANDHDDQIKLFNFLLKKGVDINAIDERSGLGALHVMVVENNFNAVGLLLSNGANPGLKSKKYPKNPLELALERQGQPDQPNRERIINMLKNNLKHHAAPIFPMNYYPK
jgi:hypothetical protein